MRNLTIVLTSVALAGLLTACPDPGKDKPKAKVEAAKGAGAASAPAAAKKADAAQKEAPAKKAAAPAGGEQLKFDGSSSKLEWTGAKVTASHPGGFKAFTGVIDLVGGKAEGSKVTVDVDVASLFTDSDKLAGHLKSPDFFDVAKFAKVTFASTAIKAGGEGGASHTVTGDMGIRGVTKSVTFPATITVSDSEVTAKAEFAINRQGWGIKYPGMPDDLIKDNVAVKLDVRAARAAKGAAAPAPAAAPPAGGAHPASAPMKADGK